MISVDIIDAQGKLRQLVGEAGATIRDLAVAADVTGLMGECGGAMACGTCHIILTDDWAQQVGAAQGDEAVILDGTLSRHPNSRLACQMQLSASLNGLQAHVAKA
jgi:ferredoxin, 2Fe-2S